MVDTPQPPWIDKLEPHWQAWREDQILKVRDPDPYIEEKLMGTSKNAFARSRWHCCCTPAS